MCQFFFRNVVTLTKVTHVRHFGPKVTHMRHFWIPRATIKQVSESQGPLTIHHLIIGILNILAYNVMYCHSLAASLRLRHLLLQTRITGSLRLRHLRVQACITGSLSVRHFGYRINCVTCSFRLVLLAL